MVTSIHWRSIVSDEALTRGLGDPEARLLVEWLVDHTEDLTQRLAEHPSSCLAVDRLYRRARAISRFVYLWCYTRSRGPATQLAATERFSWPLPQDQADPCEVMHEILVHEAEEMGE
jgi:hypothetical protein